MSSMASQITCASIVCSNVCSGADQSKHQSSTSLAFVKGIRWWPVDSPHKGPVTRKMFPSDDVIMHDWSAYWPLSMYVFVLAYLFRPCQKVSKYNNLISFAKLFEWHLLWWNQTPTLYLYYPLFITIYLNIQPSELSSKAVFLCTHGPTSATLNHKLWFYQLTARYCR